MGGGDGTHNSLLISRIPSIQEPARSQWCSSAELFLQSEMAWTTNAEDCARIDLFLQKCTELEFRDDDRNLGHHLLAYYQIIMVLYWSLGMVNNSQRHWWYLEICPWLVSCSDIPKRSRSGQLRSRQRRGWPNLAQRDTHSNDCPNVDGIRNDLQNLHREASLNTSLSIHANV